MQDILIEHYGYFPGIKGLIKYCEENNITDIPMCADANCNNRVTYNKAYPNRGFATYCGPICSRSNKTIPQAAKLKLEDHDWLYHERITLRKSKEQIANELGVSRSPVVKYLQLHNIPDVKYNSSSCDLLDDNVALEGMYSDKMKFSDIAKRLNVSVATISRFFAKHNIQSRNPNEYDRTFNKRSRGEKEISEFLSSYDIDHVCNDRKIGIELDIRCGSFAIEFNGLYYHTESFKPGANYHLNKTKRCHDHGITLFHIWSDQWEYKKDVVKSTILHKFGKTPRKIGARMCDVRPVTGSEARIFLDNNHLQGYTSASIKLGLYYGEELVALTTFSKPRFNKSYNWELVRFATLNYTHIPGAFTKLLKAFRQIYKGSIITYADLSYSQGNVYADNGFKFVKHNPPSYSYVAGNKRLSRTKFVKSKLVEFNSKYTEKYIMDNLQIPKIWDCGTAVYVLS